MVSGDHATGDRKTQCIRALLQRQLRISRAQGKKCGIWMRNECGNQRLGIPSQPRHVIGRAIAELNPDHLRGKPRHTLNR